MIPNLMARSCYIPSDVRQSFNIHTALKKSGAHTFRVEVLE
jgi:hypothetical protein